MSARNTQDTSASAWECVELVLTGQTGGVAWKEEHIRETACGHFGGSSCQKRTFLLSPSVIVKCHGCEQFVGSVSGLRCQSSARVQTWVWCLMCDHLRFFVAWSACLVLGFENAETQMPHFVLTDRDQFARKH